MLFESSFFMEKLMLHFIDIVFPQTCIICDIKALNYICTKCNQRIQKYQSNTFLTQKEDNNINRSYDHLYYIFRYEKIIRKIMIDYKFFSKSYISYYFAQTILNNKALCNILKNYDCIIPVPMSPLKEKQRGYNQTALITKIISKNLHIAQLDCLKRVNNSLTQGKLNKVERENNIKGTFYIEEKQLIQNKKVILLDDIYTTGNTVEECSRLLKEAGAKQIFVIIVAKDFMK